MSKLLDLVLRARDAGDPAALAEVIPYCQWLGITAIATEGELLGKMPFKEMLIGNPSIPALHGGTLAALLESTAVFEMLWSAESISLPKTINITVDYLRSGRPEDIFAKAVITKRGRRVVNVRVDAFHDDRNKPIASANAHFLVEPAEG